MKVSPRLEHLVLGYLYTELRGNRVNDVLRQLMHAGVALYHVRVHGTVGTAGFALSDLADVYTVCRRNRVKIRFVRKEGLPFFLRSLRRRKSMVVGVALFAGILFACQSLVWQVNVTGVDSEDAAAILHVARQSGVYPGAFKQSLPDVNKMQVVLQDKLPSMMWIGVNVVGAQVRIQALKKVEGVQAIEDKPHNIVAARPAVVRKVFATRGSVKVTPGQTVQPGALLISGALGDGAKAVPATGVVLAEVWYKSDVEVPLHVAQRALTGESVKFDTLQIGSLNVRVWGWRNPDFKAWFDEEQDTTWKVGNFQVPAIWRQVTRYEATKQEVAQSANTATQTALALARQDVLSKPARERTILGQTVLHTEVTHGKLYATILTRVEEDIGTVAPIPVQPPTADGSKAPS